MSDFVVQRLNMVAGFRSTVTHTLRWISSVSNTHELDISQNCLIFGRRLDSGCESRRGHPVEDLDNKIIAFKSGTDFRVVADACDEVILENVSTGNYRQLAKTDYHKIDAITSIPRHYPR